MSAVRALRAAANARTIGGPALRALYRIEVFGAHLVPPHGPLLVVGRAPDLLAGAVLKAVAPRPLSVLAASAPDGATPDGLSRLLGDIPNPEPGIDAAQAAIEILAAGGAVALLGDHPPAGMLALVAGAAIVPVTVIGAAGRVPTDPPRPGARIEVRFGEAAHVSATGDPLTLAVSRAAGEQIRQHVADAEQEAWARAGLTVDDVGNERS